MRRSVALIAALSLLAFAGTAAAGKHGGLPPFPRFGGTWSHAEINIRYKGQPHTLILDRGKVVQISPAQISLLESDGTTQVVQVGPQTTYTGIRLRAAFLRRGLYAETMVIDSGPAVRVHISLRP
jgi:hypothetical protein